MSDYKPGDRVRVFDPTNELLIYEGLASRGATGTVLRLRNGKVRVEIDGTGSQDTEGHNGYADFDASKLSPLPATAPTTQDVPKEEGEDSRHEARTKAASELANAEDSAEHSFVRGAAWADATNRDYRNWIQSQKQLSECRAQLAAALERNAKLLRDIDTLSVEHGKAMDAAQEEVRKLKEENDRLKRRELFLDSAENDAIAESARLRELLQVAEGALEKIAHLDNGMEIVGISRNFAVQGFERHLRIAREVLARLRSRKEGGKG